MSKNHGPFKCGWCTTERHSSCPGTITNGNGTLLRCACNETDLCGRLRCTRCLEDRAEYVGPNGICLDSARCGGRQEMSVKIIRTQMNLPSTPQVTVQSRSEHLKEYDLMSENTQKTTKAKAPSNEKGTTFLIETIEAKTGVAVAGPKLRALLRQLHKEGVIEKGEGRWTFTGVSDPNVKAVLKAVKEGRLERQAREGVAKAKKAKAKNTEAEAEAPEVEENEELDLDEDTEDEEIDLDSI